jgi:hypothetical protein
MKTIEREKAFDCVKMKNEIQAQIYAETKDMDSAMLLVYFNRHAEAMARVELPSSLGKIKERKNKK